MNLKEVKQRIQSVKTTQKITSAMKLVSAAKLRRAQAAIEGMRPYRQKLDEMLSAFLQSVDGTSTPYTVVREVRRVAIIVVSSSSSLCGGFNSNIIRSAKELIDSYIATGVAVELYPVGKKIADAIKKMGLSYNDALMSQAERISYSMVSTVATELMAQFQDARYDRVELLYSRFYSAAKQAPVIEPFLPIDIEHMAAEGNPLSLEYIVEPSNAELTNCLMSKVITLHLFTALLDSAAAEHAARMMAMQIATDNANDLIDQLVLEYNKGRQQAITNELLDIMSGSMNQ